MSNGKKKKAKLTVAEFEKLTSSLQWSIDQIKEERKHRMLRLSKYTGPHYGVGTCSKAPIGMLSLATNIYVQQLIGSVPKVKVNTNNSKLKPVAKDFELALEDMSIEMDLEQVFAEGILEGLLGICVAKVGLNTVGDIEVATEMLPYGAPFVDIIPLSKLVVDMTAETYKDIQYIGNDYSLEIEDIKNSGNFDLSKLTPGDLIEDDFSDVDLSTGDTKDNTLSTSGTGRTYKGRIGVRDLWIPKHNKIITYIIKAKAIIKEVEWDGPEGGPYHMLRFKDVPGNVLPLAPMANLEDLNDATDNLFQKSLDDAKEKKVVQAFSSDEDAKKFKGAGHGEGIGSVDGDPKKVETPGPDQGVIAMFLQAKDMFIYSAGNLDTRDLPYRKLRDRLVKDGVYLES